MNKKVIILSFALLLLFLTSISFAQETQNGDDLTAPDNFDDTVSAEPLKISIKVIWDDNNDEQGLRPDNLTFHFKGQDDKLGFFNLTTNDNWFKTWEIENVDNLELEEYYIPEGYEVTYSGNINDGFIVTNTLKSDNSIDKPLSSTQNNPTQQNQTNGSSNNQTPQSENNHPQNNTEPTQKNTTSKNNTEPTQKNTTQKDKTYNATKVPKEPKKKPPVEDKHPNTGYPILLFVIACILLAVAYIVRKKR